MPNHTIEKEIKFQAVNESCTKVGGRECNIADILIQGIFFNFPKLEPNFESSCVLLGYVIYCKPLKT